MKQPKPQPMKYEELVTDIKRGYIKIPKFQRDFVWTIEQTAELLDSIIKGYPIGTFILWKTRERLRNVKNIGSANLPPIPEGDAVQYILDGQQRIASLFAALEGLQVPKENKILNFKEIYVDLDKDFDTDDQIILSEIPGNNNWITVHDILSHDDINYFVDNYDKNTIKKIDIYRQRFKTYDFSTILISDFPIDVAAEIFTRINTTGTELTLFQIMVAKTYDETRNFDLQEKYSELQEDLEQIGYDTIPDSTVLQCLSANLVKECTRKAILKLNKNDVIEIWDETVESIKEAIDYFRMFYRIPVSRLLPYYALLVPFSYYFFVNKDKPDSEQEILLQEYFWRSSLSYRFSSAVETKLGQDTKRVDQIINGEKPEYDFNVILDKEEIKNHWFSTGDSYCKAILCLYAYFQPKSFKNNSNIILDNSWLKSSNSRNYHHFFPRAYLRKNNIGNENTIINIALVDDYLNKREIGAKSPSLYMGKFKNKNPNLDRTMKTYLIDDLDEFGVWKDDYERFLEKRSKRIVDELQKRIEV
jgi:hypothetical protein